MTSPNLASVQLPDLFSTPTVAGTADTGIGTRPVASSTASATQGGDFSRLMHLQGRGRELEAKLARQATGASSSDPAAMATAEQAKFNAGELRQLRELVGSAPGGNARRALAAVIERLEGGGQFKPTDRSRIRLAIAADDKRVDLAGANAYRHAILELDKAFATSASIAADPTMTQDPARLASFQKRNHELQQVVGQLQQAISAERVDASTAHAIAGRISAEGSGAA